MNELLDKREVTTEVERHLRLGAHEFVAGAMAKGQRRSILRPRLAWSIPMVAAQGLAVTAVSAALVFALHRQVPNPSGAAAAPTPVVEVTTLPSPAVSSGPAGTNGVKPPGTSATSATSATSGTSSASAPSSHVNPVLVPSTPTAATTHTKLLGDSSVADWRDDFNDPGVAEVFQATASQSGTLQNISVDFYQSLSGKLIVGLYDSSSGKPNTRKTTATLNGPVSAGWHTVAVPPVSVVAGQTYWIALLSPDASFYFDISTQPASSYCSYGSDPNSPLSSLPPTWATAPNRSFYDCHVLAYGSS